MKNYNKLTKQELKEISGGVDETIESGDGKCLDECQVDMNCNNGYKCKSTTFESTGNTCLRCILPL
jgi:bacteriocin-like protein